MKRLLLTLGLLLAGTAATAAPQPFQASYSVSAKGMEVGTMTTSLSYNGNSYTYQKQTTANGLAALFSGDTLTERSNGSKQGDELLPSSYLHRHKNKRKDKQEQFSFTTPTQVEGQYSGNSYQLSVPAGTLDAATMELRLMEALAANQPLNYQVVSRGKLVDYRFRKLGKETVEVPAGSYECEKVEVVHEGGERQTILWLAPKLDYAIVQVRHKEDGDVFESRLQKYQ